ncbi:unnamed protein product [Haemonchus placei]|uniref:RNase III domain-containing protein n=1 Tax=Haemonchus placei TaxID=6290 RepID=A0A0N4X2G6_HAEPC|nr:unnamed protein product [Haemonchus placei]
MASTARTVEGVSGLRIENNVNGSQKREPHDEKCGEVSCVLSTKKLLTATDGVVDSNVGSELGRLGFVDGWDPLGFAVLAFHAATSRLAPYSTRAKALEPLAFLLKHL